MHIVAAKAVALGEALTDDFVDYQKKVINNARLLCDGLKNRGVNIVSGGTDNHLMTIDLRGRQVTGKELEHELDEVNITANKNTVPGDPQKPTVTSGLRVGTPAVTTRGFGGGEMNLIAGWIVDIINDFSGNKARVKSEVQELCEKYPIY